MKPMTYMNLSGNAVRKVFWSLDLGLEDLLVVYDDVALPFGRIRLRGRGSAGGHKGMVSVIANLGSIDFPRLRIGIGSPGVQRELVDFVTDPFSQEELTELPSICEKAGSAVMTWISRGLDEAMREANQPLDISGTSINENGEKG